MKFNITFPSKKKLALLPTPIIKLNHFIKLNNKYKVWLKRDDLTGLELSGNKVRKLEYLIEDAHRKDYKHILTCGGIQSNHCRATAFMAKKLHFECTLFLRGQAPKLKTGNYLLNHILGVNFQYVTYDEYEVIDKIMEKYANNLPLKSYVIPEGGSNSIGVWGYIECFYEILLQLKEQKLKIDTIVVATGSGGTHAGLLLGKILADSDINVVSINVCDTSEFFVEKIAAIIKTFLIENGLDRNFSDKMITIYDGFVGDGYGEITSNEIRVIKKIAQNDAILIDPVYTAKAMLGLEKLIELNRLPGENILFIHTGGIFGLFPISEHF